MVLSFGIDLGTTNSCIAYSTGKSEQLITLKGGNKTLPSCVMYDKGNIIVGTKAYENRHLIKQVIYSTKRDIGTDVVYSIDDGLSKFEVTPIQVSAEILKELKKQAEDKFQSAIESVVITVPAYFNDRQKKDTLAAGKLAGFKTIRLLVEPSAAAIAYTKEAKELEHAIVYDLGGGTFDVSLIDIVPAKKNRASGMFADLGGGGAKSTPIVEVVTIEGNNRLGGDDVDISLLKLILKQASAMIKKSGDVNTKKFSFASMDTSYREKLLLWAESVKKSFTDQTRVFGVPINYTTTKGETKEVSVSIDHEMLFKAYEGVFSETLQSLTKVMNSTKREITKIILIGGSTKLYGLKQSLQELYPEIMIFSNISPDYSVALGAAKLSAADGDLTSIKLMDVVPQSIGVEVDKEDFGVITRGAIEVVIPKDSPIPCKFIKTASTETPEQKQIVISVCEGGTIYAAEAARLGELKIDGITPKETKSTEVKIVMSVDINGVLKLVAEFDDRSEELELINIISSTDRDTQYPGGDTPALAKKYNRYMRMLESFHLPEEVSDIVEKQKADFHETGKLSEEFLAVVKTYQEYAIKEAAAAKEAIILANAETEETSAFE